MAANGDESDGDKKITGAVITEWARAVAFQYGPWIVVLLAATTHPFMPALAAIKPSKAYCEAMVPTTGVLAGDFDPDTCRITGNMDIAAGGDYSNYVIINRDCSKLFSGDWKGEAECADARRAARGSYAMLVITVTIVVMRHYWRPFLSRRFKDADSDGMKFATRWAAAMFHFVSAALVIAWIASLHEVKRNNHEFDYEHGYFLLIWPAVVFSIEFLIAAAVAWKPKLSEIGLTNHMGGYTYTYAGM